MAAEYDKISGAYQTTLIIKLVLVAVSGLNAYLHTRARSTAGLAVFGALTALSALAALFVGVVALIAALLVLAVVPLGVSMTQNERTSFRFGTQSSAHQVASAAEEYLADHHGAAWQWSGSGDRAPSGHGERRHGRAVGHPRRRPDGRAEAADGAPPPIRARRRGCRGRHRGVTGPRTRIDLYRF